MLDEEYKTFIVHVAALKALLELAEMMIHPSQAAQIAALKRDEALTKAQTKYANHADVFSFNLIIKFPENTGINKHVIEQ